MFAPERAEAAVAGVASTEEEETCSGSCLQALAAIARAMPMTARRDSFRMLRADHCARPRARPR